jgi:hypothetical protein
MMQNIFSGKQLTVLMVGIALGPVDNPLSLTFAPFLLIGGYCVVIPVAIILKDKASDKSKKSGV